MSCPFLNLQMAKNKKPLCFLKTSTMVRSSEPWLGVAFQLLCIKLLINKSVIAVNFETILKGKNPSHAL